MKNQQFYTTAQAAEKMGISRVAVYKKIQKGQLKAVRRGRFLVVPAEEFGHRELTTGQKTVITDGVNRTLSEYGEVLRMLGAE